MDKFAYNYDKSYNEQLEKEVKMYKTLRLVFIIVGALVAIGGIVGVIFSIRGFIHAGEDMVGSSTPDGSHQAFQEAAAKQFAIFGFAVLTMVGSAILTIGPAIFTGTINNRTRVINEGNENYTIDEVERNF